MFQRNNEALSREQLKAIAPSIFTDHKRGDRSEKYRFIPTVDVLDALVEEGFVPVAVHSSRARNPENVSYVKHSIRLRSRADIGKRLVTFDDVLPEIALTNSHDGASGFILDAALYRLVCSNGMIAARSQGSLRYRHAGKDDLVGQVIEGTYEVVKDFPILAERIGKWNGLILTPNEQVAFAEAALAVRWPENAPVSPQQLLAYRHLGDNKRDLWTTLNVVQENIIRGGLDAGVNKLNRRVSTRKVSGVDADLRINRELWKLADRYAEVL